MMHYPQNYGMQQMGGEVVQQQPTSPLPSPTEDTASLGRTQEGVRGTANINTILDQIMNITDQSLDEAQVSFCVISCLVKHSGRGKIILPGQWENTDKQL